MARGGPGSADVELPTAAAADRAEREFVRDDTRRALREIAEYSRGDEQAPDQPTLASALRDLNSSTSPLIADGHGDSPESRTAEAVTYAGYLMLGARDSDAVTGTAEEWTDLADLELPSGCRPAAPPLPAWLSPRPGRWRRRPRCRPGGRRSGAAADRGPAPSRSRTG